MAIPNFSPVIVSTVIVHNFNYSPTWFGSSIQISNYCVFLYYFRTYSVTNEYRGYSTYREKKDAAVHNTFIIRNVNKLFTCT